jgi:hypothetical protein
MQVQVIRLVVAHPGHDRVFPRQQIRDIRDPWTCCNAVESSARPLPH